MPKERHPLKLRRAAFSIQIERRISDIRRMWIIEDQAIARDSG